MYGKTKIKKRLTEYLELHWSMYHNRLERNKLVLTTHSPYLVNYVTLVVKAAMIDSRFLRMPMD